MMLNLSDQIYTTVHVAPLNQVEQQLYGILDKSLYVCLD